MEANSTSPALEAPADGLSAVNLSLPDMHVPWGSGLCLNETITVSCPSPAVPECVYVPSSAVLHV